MVPVHSAESDAEPASAGRQSVAGAAGAAEADGAGGAEVPDADPEADPDAEPGIDHFVFVTAAAGELAVDGA